METPQNLPSKPDRSRRYTVLGVSAGLLGGAAIGLTGTLPLISQAAQEVPQLVAATDTTEPETTDPETTEAESTDTTETTETETETTETTETETDADTDDDADDDESDADSWLRDTLQPLVDDGTLTTEQLDSVVDTLGDARPSFGRWGGGPGFGFPGGGGFGGGFGHVRGFGFDLEVVAEALGIDRDELADELSEGQSIADVAADLGVDVQVVVDAITADVQAEIDEDVAEGRLTEEDAADAEADLPEWIDDFVNREMPAKPSFWGA